MDKRGSVISSTSQEHEVKLIRRLWHGVFVFKNKQGISTDVDLSLRIDSFAIINLRDVSTKLNKYIVFTMQTYKELITRSLSSGSSRRKTTDRKLTNRNTEC